MTNCPLYNGQNLVYTGTKNPYALVQSSFAYNYKGGKKKNQSKKNNRKSKSKKNKIKKTRNQRNFSK